jgi:hypothetical protein
VRTAQIRPVSSWRKEGAGRTCVFPPSDGSLSIGHREQKVQHPISNTIDLRRGNDVRYRRRRRDHGHVKGQAQTVAFGLTLAGGFAGLHSHPKLLVYRLYRYVILFLAS